MAASSKPATAYKPKEIKTELKNNKKAHPGIEPKWGGTHRTPPSTAQGHQRNRSDTGMAVPSKLTIAYKIKLPRSVGKSATPTSFMYFNVENIKMVSSTFKNITWHEPELITSTGRYSHFAWATATASPPRASFPNSSTTRHPDTPWRLRTAATKSRFTATRPRQQQLSYRRTTTSSLPCLAPTIPPPAAQHSACHAAPLAAALDFEALCDTAAATLSPANTRSIQNVFKPKIKAGIRNAMAARIFKQTADESTAEVAAELLEEGTTNATKNEAE